MVFLILINGVFQGCACFCMSSLQYHFTNSATELMFPKASALAPACNTLFYLIAILACKCCQICVALWDERFNARR